MAEYTKEGGEIMEIIVNREEQKAMDEVVTVIKQLDEKGLNEFRAIIQGMQIGITMRTTQNKGLGV